MRKSTSSPTVFSSRHHAQLWDHDRPYSYLGMHGGGGIGYCIGASVGAGLAAAGNIYRDDQPQQTTDAKQYLTGPIHTQRASQQQPWQVDRGTHRHDDGCNQGGHWRQWQ